MYFITAVNNNNDYRCVGYFKSLNKALNAIENNDADINEEGCYPYIILENIGEGIYMFDSDPVWFEFNNKTGKYKRMNEKPEIINNWLVGFAIG